MRNFMKGALAVAFALVLTGLQAARAADMSYPQGQYEGQYAPPPQAYGPPPVEENYAPPPAVAYGLPPPVAYYAPPPYVIVPGPYYAWRPYWRGYPAHYAFGYGRWAHGYHH